MTNRKISDLQEAPYKEIASEAEQRGVNLVQGAISDPVAIILIGTLDIIRELREEIEKLKSVRANS
jgi:hypothetical protein